MSFYQSSAPAPPQVRPPMQLPVRPRPPSPLGPPTRGPAGSDFFPGINPAPTPAEATEARGVIKAELDKWGLGSLADWVYEQVIVNDLSIDYVLNVMAPDREEYKQRFSANERRRKEGLRVLSPAEYIAREEASRQARKEAGFPRGFYDDTKDFEDIIASDMSIGEERDRINLGFVEAANADPDTRRGYYELYGIQGEAAMAMAALDQKRALPVLQRMAVAASTFGAAARTGYGRVSRAEAERIARLGLTEDATTDGFATLAESRSLFSAIDRGEAAITREQQLAAGFEGNVTAREAIERRRRRRQAQFEGGGGVATNQEGFAGIG